MKTPRKILFRAKRIDNGKWIEGYYFEDHNSHTIISNIPDEDPASFTNYPVYRIDPTTLSQFTSLYDKNGKRIFENDILKNDKGLIRQVKWEMSCGSCCTQVIGFGASGKGHTDFINLRDLEKVEVVGNIFDNLDMLKEN